MNAHCRRWRSTICAPTRLIDYTPPRAPLRVVLDTNVVLDLWGFVDPESQALRAALADGTAVAVGDEDGHAEVERVLQRAQFVTMAVAVRTALRLHLTHASTVRPAPAPWTCRDADDQKFLELAWRVQASALVTKDRALLKLAQRARTSGLWIGVPAAWRAFELAATNR